MKWNNHNNLAGKHATLSPSGYAWLNYDAEKMRTTYLNKLKVEQGTYLHDLASRLISNRIRVEDVGLTFNMFVNDSIVNRMDSEVLLYYSDNCFGTADAIRFDEDSHTLYIFDLKTGNTQASFKQLYIYCALFCLEYGYVNKRAVNRMNFICRLYQKDELLEEVIEPNVIWGCMEKIKDMDKVLRELKVEVLGDL